MAYNITQTNGTNLVTVADGTVDTSYTSLTLIGKNFAGYGEFQNENFVKLLENFSNSSSPSNPLQGQIWWDSTNKQMKVYTGSTWKAVSSSSSTATAPSTPITGDLWWDTTNGQLKVYGGSTWVVIGPAYTATQGQTGAVADVVTGSLDGLSHVIVKFYVANTLVAVLSKDSSFAVNSLTGFTTLNPGFNMASTSPTPGYYGDANNALNLGGVAASKFLRNDTDGSLAGKLTITADTGLLVGTAGQLGVNTSSGAVNVVSNGLNQDVNVYVNKAGVSTKALSISGTTGAVKVAADPLSGDSLAVATKQYVDNQLSSSSSYLRVDGGNKITGVITPTTTNTTNFGSSTLKFATIYATTFSGNASTANYADLAERFEADKAYPAGTVVELGGPAEITSTVSDLSENVFGVISTQAAYLMNNAAGNDQTHPPIAMQGRVPVRVTGKIKKGDRLVSAGNGLARAALRSEITAFNVIGRALEDKLTDGEGTIKAVVKVNS